MKLHLPIYLGIPLILVSGVTGLLGARIHRLERSLEDVDLRSQAMASELKEVIGQAHAIRGELKDWRSATTDRSSEDILYLKIMVLHPNVDSDLARTIATNVLRYATLYGKDYAPRVIQAYERLRRLRLEGSLEGS